MLWMLFNLVYHAKSQLVATENLFLVMYSLVTKHLLTTSLLKAKNSQHIL